jgi:hypothetical protein
MRIFTEMTAEVAHSGARLALEVVQLRGMTLALGLPEEWDDDCPLAVDRRPGYVIAHIEALKEGGAAYTSRAGKNAGAEGMREQAAIRSG